MTSCGQFAIIKETSRAKIFTEIKGQRYYSLTPIEAYKKGTHNKLIVREDLLKRLLNDACYSEAFNNVQLKKQGSGCAVEVLSFNPSTFKANKDYRTGLNSSIFFLDMIKPTLFVYNKLKDKVKAGFVELKTEEWKTEFSVPTANSINHMFLSEYAFVSNLFYFSHFTLQNGGNICLVCDGIFGTCALLTNAPILKGVKDCRFIDIQGIVSYCEGNSSNCVRGRRMYIQCFSSPEMLMKGLQQLARKASKSQLESII